MAIRRLDAFALRVTEDPSVSTEYYIPEEGWRSVYSRTHETMVVRIETDEGIVGYGEG